MVDGEDLAGRQMHEVAALVGICFQNPATQLSQVADTVFEEVAFGALNLGLDRLEVVRRTAAALEALGIDELAERDPRRLSGGQMQLVAVAGLLAMGPRHLVLDEPTAQLDPDGKQLVVDALAQPGRERHRPPDRRARHGPVGRSVHARGRARAKAPSPSPDATDDVLGDERLVESRRGAAGRSSATSRAGRRRDHDRAAGMSTIVCSGLVFDYPGGVRALDGVDLDDRSPASALRSSARTGRARPRSCATSTACSDRLRGRSRLAISIRPRRASPSWLRTSRSRSRIRTGRSSPARSTARSRSAPATSVAAERRSTKRSDPPSNRVGLTGRAKDEPVRPRLYAAQAADDRVGARDGHADRRLRRADDRPGCARRADDRGASSRRLPRPGGRVVCISHDLRFVAESFERVVVHARRPRHPRRLAGRGLRRGATGKRSARPTCSRRTRLGWVPRSDSARLPPKRRWSAPLPRAHKGIR